MDNIIKILPLLVLALVAVVVVWRGMRRKPDGTINKARGGGPDFPAGGLR